MTNGPEAALHPGHVAALLGFQKLVKASGPRSHAETQGFSGLTVECIVSPCGRGPGRTPWRPSEGRWSHNCPLEPPSARTLASSAEQAMDLQGHAASTGVRRPSPLLGPEHRAVSSKHSARKVPGYRELPKAAGVHSLL